MGLITRGQGWGAYYSAINAGDPRSASVRKLSASESFLDVLNAAKQQLLNGGKSSAA